MQNCKLHISHNITTLLKYNILCIRCGITIQYISTNIYQLNIERQELPIYSSELLHCRL